MFHQQKPTDHYMFKIICSEMCVYVCVHWNYIDVPEGICFLTLVENKQYPPFPEGCD